MKETIYRCDLCGEEIIGKQDKIKMRVEKWYYCLFERGDEYTYYLHQECFDHFRDAMKKSKQVEVK